MEDEPHLIGPWSAAGGAVGSELRLVQLDQVLGLTALAIERVVDEFGRPGRQAGDDETDVEAECERAYASGLRFLIESDGKRMLSGVTLEILPQALKKLGIGPDETFSIIVRRDADSSGGTEPDGDKT